MKMFWIAWTKEFLDTNHLTKGRVKSNKINFYLIYIIVLFVPYS